MNVYMLTIEICAPGKSIVRATALSNVNHLKSANLNEEEDRTQKPAGCMQCKQQRFANLRVVYQHEARDVHILASSPGL